MQQPCDRCAGDGKAHGADRPFEWSGPGTYPGPCPVCKGTGWTPAAVVEAHQSVTGGSSQQTDPSEIIGPKTERCPICGVCFVEFPEMYHEAEDCDGPECTCYEVIGGHQPGCPLAKR